MQTQETEILKATLAERAVIASLFGYQGISNDLSAILRPEMFFDGFHGRIFAKCVELENQGETINPETVYKSIELDRQLGGLPNTIETHRGVVLSILNECIPTPSYLEYAQLVRDKYRARRYRDLCQQAIARFEEQDFGEAKDWFEKSIAELHVDGASEHTLKMSEVMLKELDAIAEVADKQGDESSLILPTGFRDFDQLLGGGMPTQRLVSILGATGMGKTTLLLELLVTASYIHKQPVLFFSIEMGSNTQAQKLFSKHGKISTRQLQSGRLSTDNWNQLAKVCMDYSEAPFEINDRARTIEDIISISRAFYQKYGKVAVIAVDFLTLVETNKGSQRTLDTVNTVLKQLNQLKKELNTRIYLLCQIGRAVKERQDKRPKIEDAKESGMIEELSDMVLSCYRDEYYNPDTYDRGIFELGMLKSRYTNLEVFKLLFDGANSSIVDIKENGYPN